MLNSLQRCWAWFARELTEVDKESGALTRPGPPGWQTLTIVVVATLVL